MIWPFLWFHTVVTNISDALLDEPDDVQRDQAEHDPGLQRRDHPAEAGVADLHLAGHRQLLQDWIRIRAQEEQAQVLGQLLPSVRSLRDSVLGK